MVDTKLGLTPAMQEEYLQEMRNTRGWKILEETMLAKYDAAARALINGSTSNISIEDIVKYRSRCALIKELAREVGINKEDARWMNVL